MLMFQAWDHSTIAGSSEVDIKKNKKKKSGMSSATMRGQQLCKRIATSAGNKHLIAPYNEFDLLMVVIL